MTTNIRFCTIIIVFIILASCKTSQQKNSFMTTTGIFKVAVLYPNEEGKTFDMGYYEKKHMPMVAGFLGGNLKFYEIDKGVAGRKQDDKVLFVAIGYFFISNVAEYYKAVAEKRDTIVGDIKNYTNIQPVIQISEIKQLGYNNSK